MSPLEQIYETLYAHYGDLKWWPAESPFEVMVGAILTQNTAWTNVEKAIHQLDGQLEPAKILALSDEELQELIRPAGFFRQKAQYLKAISQWFQEYDGDVERVRCRPLATLRQELLGVKGVGNETADSILLYAFHLPSFVVDAYTMRLFHRLPLDAGKTYRDVKHYCESALPRDVATYNQLHALIVQNAKDHCKKKPLCQACPLNSKCAKRIGQRVDP